MLLNKESIKNLLHSGICKLTYTKIDGTTRRATGTLHLGLIPQESLPKIKDHQPEYSEDIIRYYDIDSQGWRSFIVLNLEIIQPTEEFSK